MATQKGKQKPAKPKGKPKTRKLTTEERAAMREYLAQSDDDGEAAVREKLAAMAPTDRAVGERLHAIVTAIGLTPRLWYGMPAYAKDDKMVCFFQPGSRFKTRYSTLGFSDKAKLDEGAMWATSYAVMALNAAEEARITALVKKAIS
jgi:uncharacterized protein YdhG (YjbR/CyaY superfamily)